MNQSHQTGCCLECLGTGIDYSKEQVASWCINSQCKCHTIKATGSWEVKLDDDGTVMGDFQKFRTKIMSEMLDEPSDIGIYSTGRFYSKLDDYVRTLLEETHNAALESAITLSDKIEAQNETQFDEWRAFKQFRNTLRDRKHPNQ